MYINPLSSPQCKEAFSFIELNVTDAKVAKVAHAFFGILSFIAANSLVAYGGIISILSLPLYFIALICAIRFFKGAQYNDEKKLELFREQALKDSFAQTLRLHGLANVFEYELLPHSELVIKLQEHLTTLRPEAIAILFIEFQKHTKDIHGFRPIFIEAMNQVMADVKVSAIFENPHIEIIRSSDLLSPAFEEAFLEYGELKATWRANCQVHQNRFSEPFLRILELLESHIAGAKSESRDAQKWMHRMLQDIPHLRRMKCAAEAQIEKYPILQPCQEVWGDVRFVHDSHRQLLETFHEELDVYQRSMEAEKEAFNKAVSLIDARFR